MLADKVWSQLRPTRIGKEVTSLEQLHKAIIEPIVPVIADVKTLLFVPQGAMSSLPIHAARGPDGYLIESRVVAYFPSDSPNISPVGERLPEEPTSSWLVCGWDVSAQADRESREITRTLRQKQFDVEWPDNAKIGRERMLDGTHRVQGLHVSGHGSSLAWPKSFYSKLALSPRIQISAADWISQGPQADFVFLNVCGVGRVHPRSGDLNGFPLAVRIRGAKALIAATGYIPPSQAHAFAQLFYQQAHDTDSLSAYRHTVIASIANGMTPHGWAPYAHFGRGHLFAKSGSFQLP
jgi:hypothetical protein